MSVLADSMRYGDHDPDTLADYNSGQALIRRVEALAPHVNGHSIARELMYGETLEDACEADPAHLQHSHDDDKGPT